MSSESSLILDGIFYSIPELSILNGAYLKIKVGTVCGLFGINGSGKSTLMKIAAGQLQPNSGIAEIDGFRLYKKAKHKRFTHIAYLPQDSMLPNDLKVKSIVKSFPKTEDFFKNPLVQKISSQKVGELSGGERRYLEILLLFSLNRRFYLLDEPFTGVEPLIIELIIEMIKEEAKSGKGILISDHYHQYVLKASDYAYLLQNKQSYKLQDDIKLDLKRYGYL